MHETFKVKPMNIVRVIIAINFLIFSFIAFSKTTHFVNINGYTLNQKGELVTFEELIIKDDKIIDIGRELTASADAQRIDIKGDTVIPGIIDAHGHLLGLGENLTKVDLRYAEDESHAVKLIQAFVSRDVQTDQQQWIIGRGWNQVTWPTKTFPSRQSLDKAFPNTPVFLSRVDGHAAWVNSKALALAGIDASTSSPSGGEIAKDADGNPTGLLIDNAMYLVEKHIPLPTLADKKKQLDVAQGHLLSLGITSMHDAGVSKEVRDFYLQQAAAGELNVRIYAMLSATDPNISEMLDDGFIQDDQRFLSIRSVKAYGDGALGSRGAALLAPYSDDPDNSGLLVTPKAALPALFEQVISKDFQLNFHAIGDRANRLALEHFALAFKQYPKNSARHRIEHAQVVAVEDIPLFKKFDVIPSMQPTHATSDMNMAEDRLGRERLKGAYAWQTFLKQGSRIAFGSDFPVELANPFHGLHAAVARQDGQMQPTGGWIPEQAVTLQQALRGFTLDAAYAAFQEDLLGTLNIGKKADFVVLDRDIFNVPSAEIRSTQVKQTWVNGKLVYSASKPD
jgi:predicted amidohydrolase YtcJ